MANRFFISIPAFFLFGQMRIWGVCKVLRRVRELQEGSGAGSRHNVLLLHLPWFPTDKGFCVHGLIVVLHPVSMEDLRGVDHRYLDHSRPKQVEMHMVGTIEEICDVP